MKRRGLDKPKQGSKARSYASRVFVTDARLKEPCADVYLDTIEPRILATPKPTAFTHYLVQEEGNEGHSFGTMAARRRIKP